jgi:hypothetical protein
MTLKKAEALWRKFHTKEPREIIEVGAPVELWEPCGVEDWQERRRKSPCPRVPCSHGAVLGYCLGWVLETPDGESLEIEFGDKEVLLCATPSGKALFVVDPKSDEVIAVFCGGKLDVHPEGIVGN